MSALPHASEASGGPVSGSRGSPPTSAAGSTAPLRIGQLIQTMDTSAGGTSTAFVNVVAALRTRASLHVRAFCVAPPAGDPIRDAAIATGATFEFADAYGRGLGPADLGRRLVRAVQAGEIDLLHVHGLWSPDLLAAGLACLKARIPIVWEPHGMLVREAYAQKRWKKEVFMALGMRRVLRGAEAMIFVTSDERDHSLVPSGIAPDRLRVVPLPVRGPEREITAEFRAAGRGAYGIPADAPVIVFMGRFHPVKRIDMAVRALSLLGGAHATARLLLIGGGEEEQSIRALAASLGVSERVVFGGWARGEDKWKALAAGDVLTLNSLHENFGYVAVEAMAVGTMPVLTSNLALAAECGAAGVAVVAAPDERSLADAWAGAIARRDWRATLARGGAWVRERLSPEAIGATLESLYREAVGRTTSGASI